MGSIQAGIFFGMRIFSGFSFFLVFSFNLLLYLSLFLRARVVRPDLDPLLTVFCPSVRRLFRRLCVAGLTGERTDARTAGGLGRPFCIFLYRQVKTNFIEIHF
ncbi:hypothetical protein TW95_gp1564 [Pandoravirus inopinatum]|uniref:Uncharacterized protein n=1 Tax=Pandoravirus inopinatum TaxID=1605721 RepID=A0A0B5IZH1_9VIRU|nr:hypothetical protein TW95_gp1564 [Pandoravirus inopinatum]AJF98298.1 hypothetical protein [Pandoravirus inopinatum]